MDFNFSRNHRATCTLFSTCLVFSTKLPFAELNVQGANGPVVCILSHGTLISRSFCAKKTRRISRPLTETDEKYTENARKVSRDKITLDRLDFETRCDETRRGEIRYYFELTIIHNDVGNIRPL